LFSVKFSKSKEGRAAGFTALVLAGVIAAGCSRQLGVPQSAGDTGVHPLPFQQASNQRGISPTGSLGSIVVPAGTPIAIRVQSFLSSAASHSGDSFTAILDEPIVIGGQTVAPLGAAATGRVVEAQPADRLRDPGYLRLTLTTITVNGKPLLVQSSSLFIKGASVRDSSVKDSSVQKRRPAISAASYALGKQDVGFSTERRLTFRLIRPLLF
jgi:hypothetical protein